MDFHVNTSASSEASIRLSKQIPDPYRRGSILSHFLGVSQMQCRNNNDLFEKNRLNVDSGKMYPHQNTNPTYSKSNIILPINSFSKLL